MLTNLNGGDTAWILMSAALVFLMIPGLAVFYGSLFGDNKPLPDLSLGMTVFFLITLQWVFFGYSLTYGPDHNGWIGTLSWAGLRGVGAEPDLEYAGTVPHLAFMLYRGMVAALAPVIFLSPFAERLKRSAVYLITLLWATLVSDPVTHWVWGVGGFLRISGAVDFAGGMSIDLAAAAAALALALVLRKSRDSSHSSSPPVAPAWLGALILWFGGYGLIFGNALGSPDLAAHACAMTQIAAAAGGILWLLLDALLNQKLTPLGLMTGAIAGAVAMSTGASLVNLGGALGIGLGAAIFCYASLAFLRKKYGHQEVFYTISVFGVSSLWGIVASGLWTTKAGDPSQVLIQTKAALAIALYSFGMSYLLLKILDVVMDLGPSEI